MSEQTLALIALLAFLAFAALALPAVLFIRLAGQIADSGYKAAVQWLESQHQLTSSLTETVTNGKSPGATVTPITPESPTGITKEST